MTTVADTSSYPKVLALPKFRSAVREHLVTLGNTYAGLGLMVTGIVRAALVFPRAGRSLASYEELLELKWMHATLEGNEDNPTIDFQVMNKREVADFLALIAGPRS